MLIFVHECGNVHLMVECSLRIATELALCLVGGYTLMSCVCRHLTNACEKYVSSVKLMVISVLISMFHTSSFMFPFYQWIFGECMTPQILFKLC